MSYRIGIGRIWHESNSFFNIPTELADFEASPGGLVVGEAILKQTSRSDEVTGILEVLCSDQRFEVVIGCTFPAMGLVVLTAHWIKEGSGRT